MTLTGRQKAALLLMNLDSATAGKLLEGIDKETVQDLAVELTYLEAAGQVNVGNSQQTAKEFFDSLNSNNTTGVKTFLNEVLSKTVGEDESQNILEQIDGLLKKRDPFIDIRAASEEELAEILEEQHPQVVAVILSELAPKKSSDVLSLLSDGIRYSSVSRMATSEAITPEAKARIAEMVCNQLQKETTGEGGVVKTSKNDSFRKIAIILRNLAKEVRDGMLSSIKEKDPDAPEKISELMVLWKDIPLITDRTFQAGMRGVDAQVLALALTDVDPEIEEKIKSNISERAKETLEEEASLMSDPKKEEIADARDQILKNLRELNGNGELAFSEE